MFKFSRNMLPKIFDHLSVWNRDMVSRTTRQSNELHVPISRTTAYTKTVKFQGVKIWNGLLKEIDHFCSVHTFKKRLKTFLVSPSSWYHLSHNL
jgi:hypothetical protein